METRKKILAGILITFIIVCSTLIIVYREKVFFNAVSVTYPDGCIENYENGELVTPECIEGRLLQEQNNRNPIAINTLNMNDNVLTDGTLDLN